MYPASLDRCVGGSRFVYSEIQTKDTWMYFDDC